MFQSLGWDDEIPYDSQKIQCSKPPISSISVVLAVRPLRALVDELLPSGIHLLRGARTSTILRVTRCQWHPKHPTGKLKGWYGVFYWLVVGPPLWKIGVRQLGWYEIPNISGKTKKIQTTNQFMVYHSRHTYHYIVTCIAFYFSIIFLDHHNHRL